MFSPVAQELLQEEGSGTKDVRRFLDTYSSQLEEIRTQARAIGCSDDELTALTMSRLEPLVGTGPDAEQALEVFRRWIVDEEEPTPEPSAVGYEIDWTIATCDDAADVFIERTQTLILDTFAGMKSDELEDPLPQGSGFDSLYYYVYEIGFLRTEIAEIGCTEPDVVALIGMRIDHLWPEGEVAEEVVATLRENLDNENFFDELVSNGSY